MSKLSTKKQLDNLAQEMLKEVKNIKDFAKEEIPIVAKEYVNYLTITSGTFLIVSILGMGISGYVLSHGIAGMLSDKRMSDSQMVATLLGGIGLLISFIGTCVNGDAYMQVKLQPRRTAIKAITSLF